MVNIYDYSIVWQSLDGKLLDAKQNLKLFLLLLFVDVIAGVYLSRILPSSDEIFSHFWLQIDNLIIFLNWVLTWITENPAGLKLNEPVNSTLSSFFRYHVHLWKSFVHFLRHPSVIRLVLMVPCAGVSVFAAVLGDFLQVFTLHILCFDAYASRLLSVGWSTLTSLWGLVRGKKWNPLRNRTDNIVLDTSEMFLGTTFYLILLFLLPTMLVYFAVFRVLRYLIGTCLFLLRHISLYPVHAVKCLRSQ